MSNPLKIDKPQKVPADFFDPQPVPEWYWAGRQVVFFENNWAARTFAPSHIDPNDLKEETP